jgi:hypothetical protein
VVVYGQESCETIRDDKGEELTYRKAEKSIFLINLSTRLFLSDGSWYSKNNTLLINDNLEKNIFNDTGNAMFLKSWKHTLENSSINAYLSKELGPWLKKLHKEWKGQVSKYVNNDRLCVNPLVSSDTLFIM